MVFTLPQQQLAQVNAAHGRGAVTVEALDADGKTVLDRGALQVVDNQVDQTTGTVRMKAEFPNDHLQLWPGQFVNVRVLIDTLKQVVIIPTPAVQRGPNGTFVYVVQNGRAREPATRHGDACRTRPRRSSPRVSSSERVVTTGFPRLKDGARVGRCPTTEPAGRTTDRARSRTAAASRKRARRSALPAPPMCRSSVADVERSRAIRACLQAHAGAAVGRLQDRAPAGRARNKAREADVRKAERQLHPMSVSSPFIRRPIATSLLGFAVTLGGRARLLVAAGLVAAAGRFPDHPGDDAAARRQPRRRPPTW